MFKFEKLNIWKDSIKYAKEIYKTTNNFPKNEMFGITMQLKRASISVSSNIAEGSGTSSSKNFSHFLDIAMGSLIETVSQLFFAWELRYINKIKFDLLYGEAEILMKRIQAFKKSLFNNSINH